MSEYPLDADLYFWKIHKIKKILNLINDYKMCKKVIIVYENGKEEELDEFESAQHLWMKIKYKIGRYYGKEKMERLMAVSENEGDAIKRFEEKAWKSLERWNNKEFDEPEDDYNADENFKGT